MTKIVSLEIGLGRDFNDLRLGTSDALSLGMYIIKFSNGKVRSSASLVEAKRMVEESTAHNVEFIHGDASVIATIKFNGFVHAEITHG